MWEAKYYGNFISVDPEIQQKLRKIPWHFPLPDINIDLADDSIKCVDFNLRYNYTEGTDKKEEVIQVGYYFGEVLANAPIGSPKYFSRYCTSKSKELNYYYKWIPSNTIKISPVEIEFSYSGNIIEEWFIDNKLVRGHVREFCLESGIDVNNFTEEDINIIRMKFL